MLLLGPVDFLPDLRRSYNLGLYRGGSGKNQDLYHFGGGFICGSDGYFYYHYPLSQKAELEVCGINQGLS